jgi:heme A synthase
MISPAGFRRLAVLAAISAYLQITLGTTVRVSQSGLGCPDWPLCHGRLYPILDLHSIIEFSHRALGTLTGLLVIATVVSAWMLYRRTRPQVAWVATAALGAIALEGVLGGVVVFNDLASWLVLVHLGLALLILALLSATAAVAGAPGERVVDAGFRRLALAAAILTYAVALSGSSVVASKADEVCKSWPLCAGGLTPDFAGVDALNMLHRLLAAATGLVILAVVLYALRRHRAVPGLTLLAAATGVLLLVQGFVLGPGVAITEDNPFFNGFHVAVATLVWTGAFLMALQAWRHSAPGERAARLVLEEARSS